VLTPCVKCHGVKPRNLITERAIEKSVLVIRVLSYFILVPIVIPFDKPKGSARQVGLRYVPMTPRATDGGGRARTCRLLHL